MEALLGCPVTVWGAQCECVCVAVGPRFRWKFDRTHPATVSDVTLRLLLFVPFMKELEISLLVCLIDVNGDV